MNACEQEYITDTSIVIKECRHVCNSLLFLMCSPVKILSPYSSHGQYVMSTSIDSGNVSMSSSGSTISSRRNKSRVYCMMGNFGVHCIWQNNTQTYIKNV